jgi:DNA-binding MarR family transcriptional regulator
MDSEILDAFRRWTLKQLSQNISQQSDQNYGFLLPCKGDGLNTSHYKLLQLRIEMQARTIASSVGECAQEVLDVVPMVFRVIRTELRKYGTKEVSLPQFRTLAFVYRNEGTSLSEVADHMVLTLPTMSMLVDGLVVRGLISRREDREDRRRMTLTLTQAGRARFESARAATMANLEQRLRQLSASDRATVTAAMRILRERFTGGEKTARN